jgi:hypothetical protein
MSNGFANTRFVLVGRFMEYSIKTDPGGNESYGIIMFDKKKEKYRSWFFNSDGRHNEWSGTWDKATRTLTRTADFGNGNTGTATGRFLDDGTQQFSLIGTHRDGKVFVDLKSTLKRQPEAIRVVRRRSKARATTPVELAPLEKLIGKWDDESVSKVAEWTPEEVRLKFESDHFWMLGGKFVFHESKGAIFLTTYSAQAKVFKMWHFNAGGYVHEWTGEWNADTDILRRRHILVECKSD